MHGKSASNQRQVRGQRRAERPTALVTGASYGIGAAIALDLAAAGFDLAVSARRTENLGRIMPRLEAAGARVAPLALDLAAPASAGTAVEAAAAAFGRLDVLVNNAAVPLRKPALEITPEEWDAVLRVNVTGTFFACQRMARHLVESGSRGCIVNLASTYGVVGYAGVAAYAISKAAVIHMTKTLAVEWAQYGIRVNAVAPGTVETDSRKATLADPALRQSILERVPLHRLASVEEVAGAVRYLVSPQAGYVTGQTLLVDGGLTACGARGIGPRT